MFALALWLVQSDVDQAVARLKETRLTVDLRNAPLEDLVGLVKAGLGVDVVVAPEVLARDAEELRITVALRDVSAHTLLKVTLKPKGLTITLRNGLLTVVPIEVTQEKPVTISYDTHDVILPMPSFLGSSKAETYSSLFARLAPKEDPDAPPDFDDVFGTTTKAVPSEALEGLQKPEANEKVGRDDAIEAAKKGMRAFLMANTGGESWKRDPRCAIKFVGTRLWVTQTRKTHAEIAALLKALRQYRF